MDNIMGPDSIPRGLGETTPSSASAPNIKQRRPSHRVTFSMGHAGANRKSSWETPIHIDSIG